MCPMTFDNQNITIMYNIIVHTVAAWLGQRDGDRRLGPHCNEAL